jgi:hypothetical protein
MRTTYAVRWLDPSGTLIAGKLELCPRSVVLEGANGHAADNRELPYDELAAVRVDRGAAGCIDGRPTLVLARRGGEAIRVAGIAQLGIVSELAEQIAALRLAEDMSRVAVVLPLKPGARARAEALLAQGPPFDPEAAGLESHEVFVTDGEAVFIFEALEQHLLDRLAAETSLWAAAVAWKDLIAGPPRLAQTAYSWRRPEREDDVSFAPTPGPGDSDGGDVFPP